MPRQFTRSEIVTKFLWGFIPYPAREDITYWKYAPQRAITTYRFFQNDLVKIYEGGKVYEGDAGRITLFAWGQKVVGIAVIESNEPPAPEPASFYSIAPPPPHPQEAITEYTFRKPLPQKPGVSYVPA